MKSVLTLLAPTLALSAMMLTTPSARASAVEDRKASILFHSRLQEVFGPYSLKADLLHASLPAPLNENLNKSRSIDEAMSATKPFDLESIFLQPCRLWNAPKAHLSQVLKLKPLTVVIVPGIFAEFIKTRAFESVFAKPSAFSREFKTITQEATRQGLAAASDLAFDNETMKLKAFELSKLISAGSLDDENGQPLVKVILFTSPTLSLESVAPIATQAKIYARRLEKYLALTGSQDLVLMGYSRGLQSALEMASNAQTAKPRWLKHLKAVVSYAGVIFGSSLADDLANPKTPTAQGVAALQELRKNLQVPVELTTPPALADVAKNAKILADNQAAWLKFTAQAAALAPKLADSSTDPNAPNADELEGSPALLDSGALLEMAVSAFKQMGLDQPLKDYAVNITRFQAFVDANVAAVVELETQERVKWWQTHTVPTEGITYFAVTDAMADPAVSPFEKSVFGNSLSYNQSYDDKVLLQSHRQYTKETGVALNDSQVSVPQSMFLPGVIEGLNPKQSPLRARNLGVFSSHHWALSLEVVSPMRDKRLNPFPRVDVLKALSAVIAETM